MTLAVVGDVQALGVAAWAALNSGDAVAVTTAEPGEPITHLSAPGLAPEVSTVANGSIQHVPRPSATHWIVVTRSAVLTDLLDAHADRMAGQQVLLAPGGFGGAVRLRDWFRQRGLTEPTVAETTGFPAMGVRAGASYRVRAVKRQLPFATFADGAAESAAPSDTLLQGFRRWMPDLVPSDLATTSLGNTNHLIHPPVVIANAVRIARGEPFTFYREGLTDELAGLLEAVDAERRAVVAAVGGDDRSGLDWMLGFYGDQGMAGVDLVAALRSFAPFETTPSPPQLDYRYLTDDIPYGVAAWAALARRAGTPYTNLAALQQLAGGLLGRPLDAPTGLVDAVARALHTRKDHHVIAST